MTEFPAVRSVEEWIGDSPDQVPPQRVRLRVFERNRGRCHKCTRPLYPKDTWTLEHLVAIINGGQNRESNLDVTCSWCVPGKNAEDAAIKKKGYRTRAKHFGAKQPSRHPIAGGKKSKLKRTFYHGTVRRDKD